MADTKKTRPTLVADIKDVQLSLKTAGYYVGAIDGDFGKGSRTALDAALQHAALGRGRPVFVSQALTDAQIKDAADAHGIPFSCIKAVIAVESNGGMYTDMRADILSIDGPGGFIDGGMPKILFEAKWFHKLTGGAYDQIAPNISSPVWDRKLYFGGQAEYKRYWQAAQLDERAAMKSCSWGLFQIMGVNHQLCGYTDVLSFVTAMKTGEAKQLEAFLTFIGNVRHKTKTLKQWLIEKNWAMFAEGYNGEGYRANKYDTKLAKEEAKYA